MNRQTTMAAVLVVGASACIIPDTDIEVINRFENLNAVKIVEPTQLSLAAQIACDEYFEDNDTPREMATVITCPLAPPHDPAIVIPTFLDPTQPQFQFCTCDQVQDRISTNSNLLSQFYVYVEDRDTDREDENLPKDDIYAVLLLDAPPTDPEAYNYAAYLSSVPPHFPAPSRSSVYDKPIGREDPHVRAIPIGFNTIDLCNPPEATLQPGFHQLRVVVTDRRWFQAGKEVAGVIEQHPHWGIPDLANGATYDTRDYVFYCGSDLDDPSTMAPLTIPIDCSTKCTDREIDDGG